MLETIFKKQCLVYTTENSMAEDLWNEIVQHYADSKRHYHTLEHLNNLTAELLSIKEMIRDWSTLVFSIAYHDIVYNPLKHNNEEKSAEWAAGRLALLHIPQAQVDGCKAQIIATKNHQLSKDNDTNYFTDADLAILGAPPMLYKQYASAIRKEYRIYPDLIYNPGRQKVLKHFLQMQEIYKTKYFKNRYENLARQNLTSELQSLSR